VFTKALEARVDYFQAKCYRNILKIQAAYYSRVSNKEVLDAVSMHFYDKPGKISPMSRQISDKAVTLLGHIVRSKPSDHSRRIAIDAEFKRVERTKRMVGRPRFYWLQNTMKRAHKLILKSRKGAKVDFDMCNYQQRKLVAECANSREPPFDKRRKSKRWKPRKQKKEEKHENAGVKNTKFRKHKKHRQRQQKETRGEEASPNPATADAGNEGASEQQRNSRPRTVTAGEARRLREEKERERLQMNLSRFFQSLECEFTLCLSTVKRAYRKIALKKHPDKGGTKEEFQKLGDHLEKVTIAISSFLRKFPQPAR
jgi:hypothetical protein